MGHKDASTETASDARFMAARNVRFGSKADIPLLLPYSARGKKLSTTTATPATAAIGAMY